MSRYLRVMACWAALALPAGCDDAAEPTADDVGPTADAGESDVQPEPDAEPPSDAGPPDDAVAPEADAEPGPRPDAQPETDAEPDAAAPECGDGTLDDGEACDDGNREPGDGCDATCQVEPDVEPFDGVRVATGAGVGAAFTDLAMLPDGTWLVAGSTPTLDALPAAQRVELPADGITSAAEGRFGFVMHVSADFGAVEGVAHFPEGTVEDVTRVVVAHGDVYVSGRRTTPNPRDSGYYIARLGPADGLPQGVEMALDARARPRSAGGGAGSSAYRELQPWAVGPDGRIVYGIGAEYDFDWAAVEAVDAEGERIVVPGWPGHWIEGGGEFHGDAANYPADAESPLAYSGIVLKAGRRGSLRSLTMEDYAAMLPDGNGGTKQGRFPDDYFFGGPCTPDACPGGPGYTGYRTSDKPTQRLGGVAIDRRNGDVYIGYSTQSVLPGGNPDFEPVVVAFDADGRLKWWSRLYTENDQNSTPDQYVDGLAIDYANDRLVVLARCHGNNVVNLWPGNQIAADPDARGFQNQFTGNSGNIHISWLGKLGLDDGTLWASTYVAELSEGLQGAQPFGEGHPLAGQANPNAGWPDLNTTRCKPPKVDAEGRVYVACRGRRTLTTPDAYQSMPGVGEGTGAWNEFVRVYSPDLDRVLYSTLLTGDWDWETGQGGGNTRLEAVAPMPGGVATVGRMNRDEEGMLGGVPVREVGAPAWATGGDGLFGLFAVEPPAAEQP